MPCKRHPLDVPEHRRNTAKTIGKGFAGVPGNSLPSLEPVGAGKAENVQTTGDENGGRAQRTVRAHPPAETILSVQRVSSVEY